jgi:hypothetical protein
MPTLMLEVRSREEQMAFNLRHWSELLGDAQLALKSLGSAPMTFASKSFRVLVLGNGEDDFPNVFACFH